MGVTTKTTTVYVTSSGREFALKEEAEKAEERDVVRDLFKKANIGTPPRVTDGHSYPGYDRLIEWLLTNRRDIQYFFDLIEESFTDD